jgi:hypothetical protein
MKKNKFRNRKTYTEMAVFVFSKGSQYRDFGYEKRSFTFVRSALQKMIDKKNLETEKIGLSGSIDDMSYFISGIIDVFGVQDLEIDLLPDINEFYTD